MEVRRGYKGGSNTAWGTPHVRSLFPAPVLGEAEVVLGLGGGGGQHLAVTLLEAVLQLGVAHHQHVLLVPRHQAHLHTVQ